MRRRFWIPRFMLSGLLTSFVVSGPATVRADFNALFRRVPAEANVLVVIKVNEILRTPLAIQEDWAADRRTSSGNYGLTMPPAATEIVIASQLDLERNLPLWEAGVMTMDPPPSLDRTAQSAGRPIEQLAGTPAFRSPRDIYVVQFATDVVGAMWPANYQQASYWCRTVQDQREFAVSPYLQRTVQYAQSDKAHVLMSIDLTHAVPQHILRERMAASAVLQDAGVDPDAVADLFSKVAGATLRLNVSDRIAGQLRVDFGDDVSLVKPIAKPLLWEVLTGHGAAIDEIQQWEERVEQQAVVFYGELSPESTALLLSAVQLPDVPLSDDAPDEPTTSTAEDDDAPPEQARNSETALASLEHFQKVSKSLDRLRLRRGATTMGQVGMWIENAARHIDRMPVLNVDDDLLQYSAQVATSLRDMSMAIKSGNIRQGARKAQYYGSGYYWGGSRAWGGTGAASVSGERQRVAAEERAGSAMSTQEIGQQIQQMTADIRRAMSQRYQMEF